MSSGGGAPDGSGCSPSSAAKDHCFVLSEILWHIYEYYKAALDRLPVEEMPALIPRLLGAGVCFGLLDPGKEEEEEDNRNRKWRKRTVEAATEEEDKVIGKARKRKRKVVAAGEEGKLGRRGLSGPRTVARRSLEGLVTFLICYFRQLPVSEALHYLLLAKADLLAAVHLIEHNRGMAARLFPISSPTTEISLKCAAMSASHPDPVLFAARSLSLASRLEQFSQILTVGRRLPLDALRQLHELLEEPLKEAPDSPKPMRAIARLPRDDLRGRYHHGLLKAGHCFGPANAPVTNIILNTIWYDTAFPPHEEFKVDMICTSSLVRIECRSLNGLLAFLHNLFPTLSEHDALLQGTEYELHIICGVNLEVPENGKHSYIHNEEGFPYSHVNFLARPKDSHLDDMVPKLFFLECSNDEKGQDRQPSCCTVLVSPSDSGWCFHCEYEGIKIVHPDFGTYRGRETDFEEMACGKRKVDNEELIGFGDMRMEFVGMVSDDSVYSDPATDSDFAECMNYLARRGERIRIS
ncbi:hypothetical protein SETIT_9G109100v2 [Setaria italica]|uniref:PIR2-like helical domain-containing protein n=1 Tax=Setaria italica TaxID=4555 RepID=A0A368SF80_SETIT|nr:hypothetical protein SETIT_9G109100v2 [Setaria italica]